MPRPALAISGCDTPRRRCRVGPRRQLPEVPRRSESSAAAPAIAARSAPRLPRRNANRRSACVPSGVTIPTCTVVSSPPARARIARPTSAPEATRRRPASRTSTCPTPSSSASMRPAASLRRSASTTAGNDRRSWTSAPSVPCSVVASVQPRSASAASRAPAQVVSPRAQTYSPRIATTDASASSASDAAVRLSDARAEIRMSTASWRAYVATTGFVARRSFSPSCSATTDSPTPVSRSVRTSLSAPTPRAASLGSTSSCHIGRISRGGPGNASMTVPSGRSTHHPGAVPLGFGSIAADAMRHACFTFTDGNGCRRRVHSPSSQARVGGSTSSGSPHSSATDSRVRSSGVGPSPPVVTTRSARVRASRSAATTTGWSSGRFATRSTVTPFATSDRARSPLLVSVVSPTVSSVPIATSSARRMGRGGGTSAMPGAYRRARRVVRRLRCAARHKASARMKRAGMIDPQPTTAHTLPGGRPLDPDRPAPDEPRTPDESATPVEPPAPRAPKPPPPAPAPGLKRQAGATKDALIVLVRAHVDLAKAEASEIGDEIKVVAAGAGIALVSLILIAFLVPIGTLLFLGEWLFGSLGWGVLHGTEFLALLAVGAVLAVLHAGRVGRSILLAFVAGVVVAILFGTNAPNQLYSLIAHQVGTIADPGPIAFAAGAAIGAAVFGLLGAFAGARNGSAGDAFKGLLGGAIIGALIGVLAGGLARLFADEGSRPMVVGLLIVGAVLALVGLYVGA